MAAAEPMVALSAVIQQIWSPWWPCLRQPARFGGSPVSLRPRTPGTIGAPDVPDTCDTDTVTLTS